jgi:hypothetical protein
MQTTARHATEERPMLSMMSEGVDDFLPEQIDAFSALPTLLLPPTRQHDVANDPQSLLVAAAVCNGCGLDCRGDDPR